MNRPIDLSSWNRTHIFNSYLGTDLPYIIAGEDIDITRLYNFVKENQISFYFSMIYAAVKTADSIANFRWRFTGNQPYEIERNTAFATHLKKGAEIFHMVECDHYDSMCEFARENHKKGEQPAINSNLHLLKGRDDIINFSSIPWISYNHFFRTIAQNGIDCNPKMTMGKFKKENGRILLPFSIQVHHGLMDGLHAGRFFQNLEEYLQNGNWN